MKMWGTQMRESRHANDANVGVEIRI